MCLKPKTEGEHPRNNVELVLDSVCDERQNFFEFVLSEYLSVLYITGSPELSKGKLKRVGNLYAKGKRFSDTYF